MPPENKQLTVFGQIIVKTLLIIRYLLSDDNHHIDYRPA